MNNRKGLDSNLRNLNLFLAESRDSKYNEALAGRQVAYEQQAYDCKKAGFQVRRQDVDKTWRRERRKQGLSLFERLLEAVLTRVL